MQPARGESQLRSLSEVRLAHLVSPIDSAEPADALDQAIPDWLAGEEGRPVRLVIGQPRRCYPQLLPFGADRHGMQPIDLPTPEAILEGKPDTPAYPVSRYDDDQPRMIPDLAHWYLRHLDGL